MSHHCLEQIQNLSFDYEKSKSNLFYKGEFADGLKSGKGEEIWSNHHKYVGNFK